MSETPVLKTDISLEKFEFFLGGQDLEMQEISSLLASLPVGYIHDKKLKWGAKASDYLSEVQSCLKDRNIQVFIELENDLNSIQSQTLGKTIWIDHHNQRAGKHQPTSLEQIFNLLNLPQHYWTRRMSLIAANDRGHLNAMIEMGATREEALQIRREDRRSQGVTSQDELQASKDIKNAVSQAFGLIVQTNLASSTAIADMIALDAFPNRPPNLLVFMQDKTAFFGDGKIILALSRHFPGSWYGGDLPDTGFWGSYETDRAQMISTINASA